MCLIHSLQDETKLHVKLLLLSLGLNYLVKREVWDRYNKAPSTSTGSRDVKSPPIPKLKGFNNFNFFYTKNVSLKYVKYNLISLKWWLQSLSLASTLVVFYEMLFKIIYGPPYLFKNALSDWSHNFMDIAKTMDLPCMTYIQINH